MEQSWCIPYRLVTLFSVFSYLESLSVFLDDPSIKWPAEGTTRTLLCRLEELSGILSYSTKWSFNDKEIELNRENQRKYEGLTSLNLKIKDLNSNDDGIYKCLIYHSATTTTSTSFHLKVGYAFNTEVIMKISPGGSEIKYEKRPAHLVCEITRTGFPTSIQGVMWYHSGQLIVDQYHSTQGRQITGWGKINEAGLDILTHNLTRFDRGEYLCQVINGVDGGTTTPFHLKIQYPPSRPDVLPLNLTVEVGTPVRLLCDVQDRGNPEVDEFHWREHNRDFLITHSPQHHITINSHVAAARHVQCFAMNYYFISQYSVESTIKWEAPVKVLNLTKKSLLSNGVETIALSCKVSGTNVADVLWFLGNKQVYSIDVYSIELLTPSKDTETHITTSVLTINLGYSTKTCDQMKMFNGAYTCKAVGHTAGVSQESYSSPVDVSVKFAPRTDPLVSRMIEVFLGEDVNVPCPLCANPPGLTSWTFEKGQMPANIQYGDKHVHIISLNRDNIGRYTCITTNGIGDKGGKLEKFIYLQEVFSGQDDVPQRTSKSAVVIALAIAFPLGVLIGMLMCLYYKEKLLAFAKEIRLCWRKRCQICKEEIPVRMLKFDEERGIPTNLCVACYKERAVPLALKFKKLDKFVSQWKSEADVNKENEELLNSVSSNSNDNRIDNTDNEHQIETKEHKQRMLMGKIFKQIRNIDEYNRCDKCEQLLTISPYFECDVESCRLFEKYICEKCLNDYPSLHDEHRDNLKKRHPVKSKLARKITALRKPSIGRSFRKMGKHDEDKMPQTEGNDPNNIFLEPEGGPSNRNDDQVLEWNKDNKGNDAKIFKLDNIIKPMVVDKSRKASSSKKRSRSYPPDPPKG